MKKAQTIIVAVSGGIDSVVMLDLLARGHQLKVESTKLKENYLNLKPSTLKQASHRLVVAHFDHGIRTDSGADARFVAALAEKYGLPFELGHGLLGPGASEDTARRARHGFFQKLLKKHTGSKIATAHHRDDQIETAIINILRGTNRRGLSSLCDTSSYTRPLLGWTKAEVYDYAAKHRLEWVEDETNISQRYLRNRVRSRLVPRMKRNGSYKDFCKLVDWFYEQNPKIDALVEEIVAKKCEVTADHTAIPLDLLADKVGGEILHYLLLRAGAREIDAAEIERALTFARSSKPGQHFNQFPPLILTKTDDWLLMANIQLVRV